MKKEKKQIKKLTIVAVFLMLLGTSFAHASPDWSFSLDSTDNVTWNLYFNAGDEGNTLGLYAMDFEYDTAELDYLSYTPNYTLYASLSPITSLSESEEGYLTGLMAMSFGFSAGDGYAATANEQVLLGTLAFTEVGSLINGTSDVIFDIDTGNFGVGVDSETYGMAADDVAQLMITANTEGYAQISAVPVPAAVWLLGTGLVGLLGIRRRTNGKTLN